MAERITRFQAYRAVRNICAVIVVFSIVDIAVGVSLQWDAARPHFRYLLGSAGIHIAGAIGCSWLMLTGNDTARWLTVVGAALSSISLIRDFSDLTSEAGVFSLIGAWCIASIVIKLSIGAYLIFSPKVREHFI